VTSQITLRDMFAHRSGLPEHAGDLLEDIGWDRAAILHRLRRRRPIEIAAAVVGGEEMVLRLGPKRQPHPLRQSIAMSSATSRRTRTPPAPAQSPSPSAPTARRRR
jgi:hypothetical protein